jgi:hypothetical protein
MGDSITFTLPNDTLWPLDASGGGRAPVRPSISPVQRCPTCGYLARIERAAGSDYLDQQTSYSYRCENSNCGDLFELAALDLQLIS